jgi:Rrf2 family protein
MAAGFLRCGLVSCSGNRRCRPVASPAIPFPTMRISERVDNAVRFMAELASGELADVDGGAVKAEAIATRQGISLKYLLDITRDLKRAELIRSKRGPTGGFTLSRDADAISLADVFRAVDGPLADVHDESLRGLRYPAPAESLSEVWMAIRGSLRRVLEEVSLDDLISGNLPADVVSLAADYRTTTDRRHPRNPR